MTYQVFDRILESSTSTGTGAFALGGASTGYQRFRDKLTVGDTMPYCIESLDSNGNPSGDWEVGTGTYSGVDTLTRTSVEASSNSGSAVSFAAGAKRVFLDASAAYLASLAPRAMTIDAVTGTTYAFAATDSYKHKRFTNGSAIVATIPKNATAAIPVGTRIRITQAGAGQITLTAEDGTVTLNSRGAALKSAGQFAVLEIEKVATNEWDVLGDATA